MGLAQRQLDPLEGLLHLDQPLGQYERIRRVDLVDPRPNGACPRARCGPHRRRARHSPPFRRCWPRTSASSAEEAENARAWCIVQHRNFKSSTMCRARRPWWRMHEEEIKRCIRNSLYRAACAQNSPRSLYSPWALSGWCASYGAVNVCLLGLSGRHRASASTSACSHNEILHGTICSSGLSCLSRVGAYETDQPTSSCSGGWRSCRRRRLRRPSWRSPRPAGRGG